MSHRSLIELNHDFCPQDNDKTMLRWMKCLRNYLTCGDPLTLPYGATLIATRHHSDPEFVVSSRGATKEKS